MTTGEWVHYLFDLCCRSFTTIQIQLSYYFWICALGVTAICFYLCMGAAFTAPVWVFQGVMWTGVAVVVLGFCFLLVTGLLHHFGIL